MMITFCETTPSEDGRLVAANGSRTCLERNAMTAAAARLADFAGVARYNVVRLLARTGFDCFLTDVVGFFLSCRVEGVRLDGRYEQPVFMTSSLDRPRRREKREKNHRDRHLYHAL